MTGLLQSGFEFVVPRYLGQETFRHAIRKLPKKNGHPGMPANFLIRKRREERLDQKVCFMPRETTDGEAPIPLTVLAAEVVWLKP